MGVGHVSTGAVPQAGEGDELSRRQHRGTRAQPAPLGPSQLARLGEQIACHFLRRRGIEITHRNLGVGRGELDIVGVHRRQRLAVEVKTRRRGTMSPIESFSPAKARQVRTLAGRLGIGRVDLIAVTVSDEFVEVWWLPTIA